MLEGLLQPAHVVLILVVVLIIFGPGKLADVGRALGQTVREFRESSDPGPQTAPPVRANAPERSVADRPPRAPG